MSKTESLYKKERFLDGHWQDVKGKDQDGNIILKVAKIKDEQAEMLNLDSKINGLRWTKTDASYQAKVNGAKVEEKTNEDAEDDLKSIQLEYEEVTGEKPHHKKGIDTLKKEIEEAKKDL